VEAVEEVMEEVDNNKEDMEVARAAMEVEDMAARVDMEVVMVARAAMEEVLVATVVVMEVGLAAMVEMVSETTWASEESRVAGEVGMVAAQ